MLGSLKNPCEKVIPDYLIPSVVFTWKLRLRKRKGAEKKIAQVSGRTEIRAGIGKSQFLSRSRAEEKNF